MKRYTIYGCVTTELTVEIGTIDLYIPLTEAWDMIMQIFDDGSSYPEGLFAKRS